MGNQFWDTANIELNGFEWTFFKIKLDEMTALSNRQTLQKKN